MAPVEIADRLRVEGVVDAARQRAREHDHVRTASEIADLVEQHLELLRLHMRSPLVYLRVRRRRRVDNGGRGARLVGDPHEIVEDGLRGQLFDDARSRASAGESRRDDGDITRDVDAFAAGKREALARPVTMAQLEVRHRQRAVDRGVQGHRDDHENQSLTWLSVRPV